MSNFFWDKFWDFIVNLLAMVAGGGAIVAWIEWQRHRRERQIWEKEEERVAIDVMSAEISVVTWQYSEDLREKEQLRILKHHLDRTVNWYRILLKLVIRNTTNTELVITGIETEEPGILPRHPELKRHDAYRVYNLETVEHVGDAIDKPMTLTPYSTLGKIIFIDRGWFDENQRLETPPATVVIKVETSEGYEVVKNIPLKHVPEIEIRYSPSGEVHYGEWVGEEEIPKEVISKEEIPF